MACVVAPEPTQVGVLVLVHLEAELLLVEGDAERDLAQILLDLDLAEGVYFGVPLHKELDAAFKVAHLEVRLGYLTRQLGVVFPVGEGEEDLEGLGARLLVFVAGGDAEAAGPQGRSLPGRGLREGLHAGM